MTKREFEKKIGLGISQNDFNIVYQVYASHLLHDMGGKDKIATIYKMGGMPLVKNMLCTLTKVRGNEKP